LLGPGQPAPGHPPVPAIDGFDGQRAFDLTREIAERFPNRTTGSEADAAAVAWVAERFAELALPVTEQRFDTWGTWDRTRLELHPGRNVLAVSAGQEAQALVIGAHRDVVPSTVQGAEDNASGTGALLELARVLTAEPHRLTYVFVSFGAEETGLGGSRYYVAHASLPTALAISVDTVGQANGRRLMLADAWSLPQSAAWYLYDLGREEGLVEGLPRRDLLSLARLALPPTAGVTDSLPFALRGQAAVGVGWLDPPYPYAHTPGDTIDRVSPESLSRAGRLIHRFVRTVDAAPELLVPDDYLLSEDGRYVGPGRIRLAAAGLAAFALGQLLLTVLANCASAAPGGGWRGGLAGLGGAAGRSATAATCGLLGGLVLLAHPGDVAPSPHEVLLWIAWWSLCAVLPGLVWRRAPPADLASRRLEVVFGCVLSFLGFSLLVNPFFAVLAGGYPLLVLSWLPLGRSRRIGWPDWVLVVLWGALALAAMVVAGVASVFVPEIVPPAEATLAVALLLWPLTTVLGVLRDRRAPKSLVSSAPFR
jgi:hypothetical protein